MKVIRLIAATFLLFGIACNGVSKPDTSKTTSTTVQSTIMTEDVSYTSDSVSMKGLVAYDTSIKAKLPVVLIVHEWWGLNDYIKGRAKQIAGLGYLVMAVDMYGNGQVTEDPKEAEKLSAQFYKDPTMSKARFDAAIAKIKTFPMADTNKIAAIGYCFGGGMVLNFARMGENLKGVVSFHGNLLGAPLNKSILKSQMLVCQGEADKYVKPEEVVEFKKEMEAAGIPYSFRSYPDAEHGFTNPQATEIGKKYNLSIAYNAAADTASFKEMTVFLNNIFK